MSMSQVEHDDSAGRRATLHLIQEALRDVHDSINALGGVPASERDRAGNEAVGKALAIIEAKMVEVGHGA